jgi:hypothetical protein
MDDNNSSVLQTSQQEWAIRLSRVIHPLLYEGIQSMFKEAMTICKQSQEEDKYLMTFQNILSRIPKWNEDIIKTETNRIIENSGCSYLEDLLTCVHIAQLKILSAIRTGKAQKKVEIDIPKLSHFIHKVYIALSRDLYANVFLFEKNVQPLVFQQNRNKINEYIKDAILNSVRDSIPVENLLRAYLDETTDFIKEVPKEKEKKGLSFSDKDSAITVEKETYVIDAPKDVETLEKITQERHLQRKAEEAAEADEDKIKISDEIVSIDIEDLTIKPDVLSALPEKEPEIKLDIEILE